VITAIAGLETLSRDPDQKGCEHPGYLEGYGVIDADQVRQLAETAVVRPLSEPTVTDEQAVRYQPTGALAAWVRARSLTCSFPGCDRPAWRADLDHSVPSTTPRPPRAARP
jgi:hypothetical protein